MKLYITETEHQKCTNVINAFTEYFEQLELLILDAGRYGFVKLQYFDESSATFYEVVTFTNSEDLFYDLWNDWLNFQLLSYAKEEGAPMAKMEYEDIFHCLPPEKHQEFLNRYIYFVRKSKLSLIK